MATNETILSYQRERVSGATAVGLVIMLYDTFVGDLRRAILAIHAGDIQQRSSEINHALLVLQQLDGSLDMEKGGDLAKNLTQFYGLARAALLEAQFKNATPPLEKQIDLFLDLRATWDQLESPAKAESTAPAVPKKSSEYAGANSKAEPPSQTRWVG